jgi:glycyl-tRNA synthetase alpha chain
LLRQDLPLPAYDQALKCSHVFNLLDARGAISVTERQGFIKRVRDNARGCAEGYLRVRERLGYPLLKTRWTVGEQPPVLEGAPASAYWRTVSFEKKAEPVPRG